jgi:hypothetical protein
MDALIAVAQDPPTVAAPGRNSRRVERSPRLHEPGERTALPNASLHVHQPLGRFQGQASDILIHAEDILQTKRRLTRLYAKHCGRTYEEVERTLDRDHFMDAESARDWGLIDRILSTRSEAEICSAPPPYPHEARRRSDPSWAPLRRRRLR